jgi:hypothetical protein
LEIRILRGKSLLFEKVLFLDFGKLWRSYLISYFLEMRNFEENYYYWKNPIFGFWKVWKCYFEIME